MPSYLETLTIRLATAVGELPAGIRERHGEYLLRSQQPDGGFSGRQGGSDLYYTGFGLRGLAILGLLEDQCADRAASFLRGRLAGQESIVDFLSLIYGAKLLESAAGIDVFQDASPDWADSVYQTLCNLRRDDGGFAKGPEGMASSTYHSFLVLLCLELIDRPVDRPDQLVAYLRSQAVPDGGFREIRVSKRAGTNPTAAAIAALRILNGVDDASRDGTVDFLAEMQDDDGGLRANTRIPTSDGLSTFTGLVTLLDLQATDVIDIPAALAYVHSLEAEGGGFHGAVWDVATDVEYTFYGLGSLALLQSLIELP